MFIRTVFGATGDERPGAPTELRINDSLLMVSDATVREKMTAFLYVYVTNADETWHRAVSLGALSLEVPFNTPYGDRRGMVRDAWGNTWQIATQLRR
jgi:PhnB protein